MKKIALLLSVAALGGWAGAVSAGDITGKVTVKGTPPPERTIAYDETCSKIHPTVPTTRHWVVGKDHGLGNVFIYISKGLEGKTFTPADDAGGIGPGRLQLRALRVRGDGGPAGADQEFDDPFMHNIHAMPKVDGNSEFNFAEPSQGDVNDTKWIGKHQKARGAGQNQMRRP